MFLFLIPQKMMAESLWVLPPMKPPRWGLNLSPLLIINLLHFRLSFFATTRAFSTQKKVQQKS